MIPLSEPFISGNEWAYVKECLDTGWVSSAGPFVDRFERAISEELGGIHAVATINGTSALHIALIVAGVEPNEEVIVPCLTFIAPANAVRYIGAYPVFVDVDPTSWQLDVNRVRTFLREGCTAREGHVVNRSTGRRVKAILPVDLLGHPFDADPLTELARDFDLPVIEDATESLGARYKETPVGTLGDIGCLSFNGNKLVTTGGGGMILTRSPEEAERARYLTTQAKDDPIEYVHGALGYNYRLSNVQAAIGCAQIEKLPELIELKKRIYENYGEGLGDTSGIDLMPSAPWADAVYWLSTIVVDRESLGIDSRTLMLLLRKKGIQSRPLWQPLHLSRVHQGGTVIGGEVSEHLYRSALSLPSSAGLTKSDQDAVIDAIRSSTSG